MAQTASPRNILDFWFDPASRARWFVSNAAFDDRVRDQMLAPFQLARQGGLDAWRADADGALALCLLLDQAPRNMFRGTADAFGADAQARDMARHILSSGFDRQYDSDERRLFAYLPFEHSEDIDDQQLSVRLFAERIFDAEYQRHARQHRDIIARFGRFPHRNAALGRVSTAEETAFLRATPYG